MRQGKVRERQGLKREQWHPLVAIKTDCMHCVWLREQVEVGKVWPYALLSL